MAVIWIKQGSSKPLWYGNPWVYPKSILSIEGEVKPGDVVEVKDSKNKSFIGYGFYNPHSFFQVRILSRKEEYKINKSFFQKSIRNALLCRKNLYQENFHDSFRIVNSEGDFLPGFTADLFHDVIILKLTSLGYYQFLQEIAEALKSEIKLCFGIEIKAILNKITAEERVKEGIEDYTVFLTGALKDEEFQIMQDGYQFKVKPMDMQKTGFFLDQRYNRLFLKDFFRGFKNLKVLDTYCYTGAFSHYLSQSAKTIELVDSSKGALELAALNLKQNQINNFKTIEEDTVRYLKDHYGYDLIILDPPKILKKKEHSEDALKKYSSVNEMAALSLKEGGYLATFSCSGNVDIHNFESAVIEGFRNAGRNFKILHESINSPDHPFLASVPETGYLKFIFIQVF